MILLVSIVFMKAAPTVHFACRNGAPITVELKTAWLNDDPHWLRVERVGLCWAEAL